MKLTCTLLGSSHKANLIEGCVNVSFQARVANSIPGLIHAHAINTKPNRIFSFFIPFPIPWGVIISKRSTEIIT